TAVAAPRRRAASSAAPAGSPSAATPASPPKARAAERGAPRPPAASPPPRGGASARGGAPRRLGAEPPAASTKGQAGEEAVGPVGVGAQLQVPVGVVEPTLPPGGQAETGVGEHDAVLEGEVPGEAQGPVVERVGGGEVAPEHGQATQATEVVGDR